MRHSFLDKYAYQDTPVHRLDGRVKLIVLVALILAAVTTPLRAWWAFAGYLAFLAAIVTLARVPPVFILTRWLVILPFAALTAASAPFLEGGRLLWSASVLGLKLRLSEHGLTVAAGAMAGSSVSVLALITLLSVTPMAALLESLRRLRAPAILVMLTGFAYRFVFVLVDEAERLKVARDSRSFGGSAAWHVRVTGRMIASIFIRSCERAERVYAAMLSRGYDANGSLTAHRRRPLARRDMGFLAAGLALLLILRSSVLWLPKML